MSESRREPRDPAKKSSGLRRIARLAFFAFASLSILCATARFFWIGELVANLRWQVGEAGLAIALLLFLARARRMAVATLAISGLHVWPALALLIPRVQPVSSGPELCVASCNLWYANQDEDRLRAWLATDQPDVAALFEISEFWAEAIPRLSHDYPYQVIVPSPDLDERRAALLSDLEREDHEIISPYHVRWGLALISRTPLEFVHLHGAPECPDPYVEAETVISGARIHVVALHPERPGLPQRIARRNRLLEHVAASTRWTDMSIVCGDLNATLYSPAFADFVEAAQLIDTRQGFGRQASWNPPMHLPGYWIDLDHILVRAGFAVLDCRLGSEIGSDHLPVIARLRSIVRSPERGARSPERGSRAQ